MDHLLKPQDCVDLKVELPYLCEGVHDEGADFNSFPSRRGYTLDGHGRLSLQELRRHQTIFGPSFVQAWLFFGLLQQYFGDDYHLNDYIKVSKGPQHKLVILRVLDRCLSARRKNC